MLVRGVDGLTVRFPRANARPAGLGAGRWLIVADLAATWFFAVEGAVAARHRLDVLGVVAMGMLTAFGGGMVRDLLIGRAPAALRSCRWLVAGLVGAGAVVALGPFTEQLPGGLALACDTAALALFAVDGATKAVEAGANGPVAALLGVVTAVGGGIIRDSVLSVPPAAFRGDIQVAAAFVGASMTVLAHRRRAPSAVALGIGFTGCIVLRMLGARLGWMLPIP